MYVQGKGDYYLNKMLSGYISFQIDINSEMHVFRQHYKVNAASLSRIFSMKKASNSTINSLHG